MRSISCFLTSLSVLGGWGDGSGALGSFGGGVVVALVAESSPPTSGGGALRSPKSNATLRDGLLWCLPRISDMLWWWERVVWWVWIYRWRTMVILLLMEMLWLLDVYQFMSVCILMGIIWNCVILCFWPHIL